MKCICLSCLRWLLSLSFLIFFLFFFHEMMHLGANFTDLLLQCGLGVEWHKQGIEWWNNTAGFVLFMAFVDNKKNVCACEVVLLYIFRVMEIVEYTQGHIFICRHTAHYLDQPPKHCDNNAQRSACPPFNPAPSLALHTIITRHSIISLT